MELTREILEYDTKQADVRHVSDLFELAAEHALPVVMIAESFDSGYWDDLYCSENNVRFCDDIDVVLEKNQAVTLFSKSRLADTDLADRLIHLADNKNFSLYAPDHGNNTFADTMEPTVIVGAPGRDVVWGMKYPLDYTNDGVKQYQGGLSGSVPKSVYSVCNDEDMGRAIATLKGLLPITLK